MSRVALAAAAAGNGLVIFQTRAAWSVTAGSCCLGVRLRIAIDRQMVVQT